MKDKIPEIDNEFFCIVNHDNPILSAVVSSFISKFGKYLPLFEFSSVTTVNNQADNNEDIDEHQLSRVRAQELNIKIENTLKRIGGCNILLLVDLSDDQKSYLTFLKDYNIIEIKDVYDAELYLKYASNKIEYISCKSNDIHSGLYFASENNLILKIDENAKKIELNDDKDGLIIIENIDYVSTIIAVNYAISINATIRIVEQIKLGEREIYQLIEKWQEDGDTNSYNDLSASIYPNVEDINFTKYQYATFFTIGIPYSLILENIIPFTHVHLYLNPDFFIFNNIYFENNEEIKSAIVFSPLEFNDEETDYIISNLTNNHFFVKELIGKDATVYNIDNHVKEYPFDILHICSHGGEINGFEITEKFVDSNGNSHIVEYDEVVSFAPSPGKELIPVTKKMIFRKFDGFKWKSKELKEIEYPQYVFSDMLNAIHKNEHKNRIPKIRVSNSCSIKCCDFNYQAMFNLLAGNHSPFIFNNTCWSYSDISHKFIEVGAKAYIGTLWGVNNNVAKKTAETFYDELFNNTILGALQKSLSHSKGTKNENIYLMWGLHFTSIKAGISNEESKKEVALALMKSTNIWIDKLNSTKKSSLQKNITELIEWNKYQLGRFFINEIKALIDDNTKDLQSKSNH